MHSMWQTTTIGEAQHQRACQILMRDAIAQSTLLADLQQRHRRQVRDVQTLDEEARAIEEAVEGEVMQQAIWNDDEMRIVLEALGNRVQQQMVETPQQAQAVRLQT